MPVSEWAPKIASLLDGSVLSVKAAAYSMLIAMATKEQPVVAPHVVARSVELLRHVRYWHVFVDASVYIQPETRHTLSIDTIKLSIPGFKSEYSACYSCVQYADDGVYVHSLASARSL